MTRIQEKARAQVKQMVGQMIGDDQLVVEGREQQRKADQNEDEQPKDEKRARTVSRTASAGAEPPEQPHDPAVRKGPDLE
jgi:uncharacterized protein YjbJ (UPF0337 family)